MSIAGDGTATQVVTRNTLHRKEGLIVFFKCFLFFFHLPVSRSRLPSVLGGKIIVPPTSIKRF